MLLAARCRFDEIELCRLVVSHTHDLIDQMFKAPRSRFVASSRMMTILVVITLWCGGQAATLPCTESCARHQANSGSVYYRELPSKDFAGGQGSHLVFTVMPTISYAVMCL
jgi:hypothetical protein